MTVLCPTCHGKGSIPDPRFNGKVLCISKWPEIVCRTCGGGGWVDGFVHQPPRPCYRVRDWWAGDCTDVFSSTHGSDGPIVFGLTGTIVV
jgi:hypothetical protein